MFSNLSNCLSLRAKQNKRNKRKKSFLIDQYRKVNNFDDDDDDDDYDTATTNTTTVSTNENTIKNIDTSVDDQVSNNEATLNIGFIGVSVLFILVIGVILLLYFYYQYMSKYL